MAKEATIKAVKDALKKGKERKFRESVELAINLKEVDLALPKNRIDEEVILPHGRGRPVLVAIFGSHEMAVKAKGVADEFVDAGRLDEMAGKKREAKKFVNKFDFFVAEAPLMPAIGKKLGQVMGPRGKMPRPIPPGADPTGMVNNIRKSVRARSKDKMTFHIPVGTREQTPEQIADNIDEVMKRVLSRLERGAQNVRSAFVKTTMGPSIRLEVS